MGQIFCRKYFGSYHRNKLFSRKGLFQLKITILASTVYWVFQDSWDFFNIDKVNLKLEG